MKHTHAPIAAIAYVFIFTFCRTDTVNVLISVCRSEWNRIHKRKSMKVFYHIALTALSCTNTNRMSMLKRNRPDFHHDIPATVKKNANDDDCINSYSGNKWKQQQCLHTKKKLCTPYEDTHMIIRYCIRISSSKRIARIVCNDTWLWKRREKKWEKHIHKAPKRKRAHAMS